MARVAGYSGNVYVGDYIVHECDVTWDEQIIANVIDTLDTTDYKVGGGSAKFEIAGAFGLGLMGSIDVVLATMAAETAMWGWVKCDRNAANDDYRVIIDNHALCASPNCEVTIPVLVANVWKFCFMPVVTLSFAGCTLPISIGIDRNANDPAAITNLWLDHLMAGHQVVGIREWSLTQTASVQDTTGFSDGQDKVFTVTQKEWAGSFSGSKDGPPLAIGTHIALELMEAEIALPGPSTQAWRGQAVITNCSPASSVDGVVQYSYNFQGIHALEVPTA